MDSSCILYHLSYLYTWSLFVCVCIMIYLVVLKFYNLRYHVFQYVTSWNAFLKWSFFITPVTNTRKDSKYQHSLGHSVTEFECSRPLTQALSTNSRSVEQRRYDTSETLLEKYSGMCWPRTAGVGTEFTNTPGRFGAQTCGTGAPHCGAWATHTHTVLVDPVW